jgi:2-oxoisovalerate ferredoxin oxidoreductase alpha subunit
LAKHKVMSGNYAVAYGAALSRVELISAYPITPQTSVVEKLSEMIETGGLNAKLVRVESEHSALAACIGGASAGARTFTATSSHGLLYMNEMVFWAGYGRLPVVMAVITRSIAPPWGIWSEHTDLLAQRDTGWVTMMVQSNQEALDSIIQAYAIAEDEDVMLPVMVGLDAFTVSHTSVPVELPSQEEVDRFLPRGADHSYLLDFARPKTMGNLAYPEWNMEFRYLLEKAMKNAERKIITVDKKFSSEFGRTYGGSVEHYRMEDAKYAVVVVGAPAGEAKDAVDLLRKRGIDAGVVRVRVIRPFPKVALRSSLAGLKGVAVLDRDISPGLGGILFSELTSALYGVKRPPAVRGFIAGLGGREIKVEDIIYTVESLVTSVEEGPADNEWLDVKKELLP